MIPQFVRPYFWSYNTDQLDLIRDKKKIITNVLNLGPHKATDWLFKTYQKEDIKDCLVHPMPGEWNKKSLYFWSFMLDVTPGKADIRILD